MSILLKVACPDCGEPHDAAAMGAELRCRRCGRDFRAIAEGENASRVLSVTPDNLDDVPYSQRSIEVPVNKVSSLIPADPSLLTDKLLRDAPLKENARWVGKVRLIRKLGQGGMGAVYRGIDESLGIDVAVKVLPLPSGERDDQFVQRFRQEARISAQINHPNVVRTLQVEEQGDLICLVMDFIEGRTARALVDSKGPLPLPLALQIIHDAAKGMQAAHANNVIHRDIKPDNILVADDGRVLLSDLGLAKAASTGGQSAPVTRLGLLLGTPEYMSPEQWEIGARVGPAADIWAMGATLWMLLTHKPPFDEPDAAALARKIKEAPLPDIRGLRSNIPDSVLDVLEGCLAKKPADRFTDAEDLLAALNTALDDLSAGRAAVTLRPAIMPLAAEPLAAPQAAPPPAQPAPAPALERPRRQPVVFGPPPAPKSRTKLWLAAAAAVAVVCGGLVYGLQVWSRSAAVRMIVSLSVRCPTHAAPGEEAALSATVNGGHANDHTVVWHYGQEALTGYNVRARIEHDTQFTVIARNKNTGREVGREEVKVAADLVVRAAEKEFYETTAGAPLKLEGQARGGAGAPDIELRWVELSQPDAAIASGAALELGGRKEFEQPGRYTFVFQARRKDRKDWSDAAAAKVVVQVNRRVPPEFQTAMREGGEAREKALAAASGTEARENWQAAQTAFEKAAASFEDDDAKRLLEECKQRAAQEERYLGLFGDARRLRVAAEQVPATDGVRRLAAWSEALRASSAALALHDWPESRELAVAVEAKVKELKATLETAEDERTAFDSMIAQARHEAREGKKYLKHADALPHWETALAGFQELARKYPRRADEFALELKEVQENRDKAFLHENFGVIPASNTDKQDQPPAKAPETRTAPKPAIPAPAVTPAPAPKTPARIPESKK